MLRIFINCLSIFKHISTIRNGFLVFIIINCLMPMKHFK